MMQDNFTNQFSLQEEESLDIKKEVRYYLFFWPYFIVAVTIATGICFFVFKNRRSYLYLQRSITN